MNETLMLYGGNRFNVMDYAPVNPNLVVKEDKTKKRTKRSTTAEADQGEQISVEQVNESKEYMKQVIEQQDSKQDSKYLEVMQLQREIAHIIEKKEKS